MRVKRRKKVGLDNFLTGSGPDAFRRLLDGSEASGPEEDFHCTDLGNGERFVYWNRDRVRFCQSTGRWFVWNGVRWEPDARERVIQLAKETVRHIYAEASGEPSPELRERIAKHATASEKAERINSLLKLARSEPGIAIESGELDTDPRKLGCRNGTLNLSTGSLERSRPKDLITKVCGVEFDPSARCPAWRQFIRDVFKRDKELIAFIQRAIGYTLTGLTNERALFFTHGTGKNGKSTLIRTVQELLGDYAIQAPPNLLVAKRGESHPTEYMRLAGARMVVASETEDQRRLDEGFVKQMTGGSDKLSARAMYRDFVDFTPTHKLWLSGNHKPVIKGTDHAIWDRIRLVPFAVRFDPPDTSLPERLLDELPGILAWAVEGCLEWSADGLGDAAAVAKATDAYRNEMDVLGAFLKECCELGSGLFAMGPVAYARYGNWCERSGERPLSRKEFYKALEERGFEKRHSGGTRFAGLALIARFKK